MVLCNAVFTDDSKNRGTVNVKSGKQGVAYVSSSNLCVEVLVQSFRLLLPTEERDESLRRKTDVKTSRRYS